MPHSAQSASLPRTYTCEAGSSPTNTTASPGRRGSSAAAAAARALTLTASAFPSIRTAMVFLIGGLRFRGLPIFGLDGFRRLRLRFHGVRFFTGSGLLIQKRFR